MRLGVRRLQDGSCCEAPAQKTEYQYDDGHGDDDGDGYDDGDDNEDDEC